MSATVLAFADTLLEVPLAGLPRLEVAVALAAGELVLVELGTTEQECALVDAALGLVAPLAGTVKFRDHDWQRVPAGFRDALRGRCGLVPREGGMLSYAGAAENILLTRRYHERTPDGELMREASAMARRFALPGVPTTTGSGVAIDRLFALCMRAFLGEPLLVVLESRPQPWPRALVPPLVDAMQDVRERGGGVLWCLADDPLFDDPTIPASRRLRLRGRRLGGEPS